LHANDEKHGGHRSDNVFKIDPSRKHSCIFSDGATYQIFFMKTVVNYFLRTPMRGG
jgi:hypothetical protein